MYSTFIININYSYRTELITKMTINEIEIVFRMNYTKGFLTRFLEQYSHFNKYSDNIDDREKMQKIITKLVRQNLYDKDTIFNQGDVTFYINDIVNVSFTPYSQKYLDEFEARKFTGKLFHIDSCSDNALFIEYVDHEQVIQYNNDIYDYEVIAVPLIDRKPYYVIRSLEQFAFGDTDDDVHRKYFYACSK